MLAKSHDEKKGNRDSMKKIIWFTSHVIANSCRKDTTIKRLCKQAILILNLRMVSKVDSGLTTGMDLRLILMNIIMTMRCY